MNRIALLLTTLLTIGCTNANVPLNPVSTPVDRRAINHTRAAIIRVSDAAPAAVHAGTGDGWFVGLAISGGGSRSANFAAASMFELQKLGILQKVDAISSVSGGSLTAAYYCAASDTDWNPANLQQRLTYTYASDALTTLLQPWNILALSFSDYDRSDILAAAFNRKLFTRDGKILTFADLRPDRPRLLINSTDLQSGSKFVFSNEYFDAINSDLSRYPLGNAVAASSAVPVVLHPVTLRDYSTIFKQYRHLVDGGIVDNLGLLSLLETYKTNNDLAAKKKSNAPYPKGAIMIIVDAGTQYNARLSDKGDIGLWEGLGTGARLSTDKLLERASSATLADVITQYVADTLSAEVIRKHMQELADTGYTQTTDRDGRPLMIVHIALSQARTLKETPFHNFGSSLDEIDTNFDIDSPEAYNLYQAAKLIIHEKFEDKLTQLKSLTEK